MKPYTRVLVVWAALASLAWGSGTSVGYLKNLQLAIPGATAAYSLDPLYAEASASGGLVTIIGKNPGEAKIVVVTAGGVQTLAVTVLQPPPSYPPGFVPPAALSYFGESGTYDMRYSSDPSQWVNTLNFVRRQGSRKTEFRFTNANLLRPQSDSPAVSFPVLSYSITTQHRGITLLDESVDNSTLTVDGATVRGLHYWQGGWNFHAGFASQTSFRDLLLSTDREAVAGISRSFRLSRHSELIPNFYAFRMHAAASAGRNGEVASLLYRYKASDEFNYSVEVGASRGFAVAGQLEYSRADHHLRAQFRNVPQQFAGLDLNQVRGQSAQVDWSKALTTRLTANANFSRNSYALVKQQNVNLNSSLLLRFAVLRHWIVEAGAGDSGFTSEGPWRTHIRTVNIPLGTDIATRHFGAGVQYQFNRNLAQGPDGHQVRGNVRAGWGPVQVTGFMDQQTQTPTLQTIAPQNSPLADSLRDQSALAATPQAISAAMQDAARLANLGYLTSAKIGVALRRRQFGGNLTWMRRAASHDQLTYNFLHDSDDPVEGGRVEFSSHSFTFSRQLTPSNDIGVSLSLFDGGPGGYHLRYQLDMRHRFNQIPSFFAPSAHGSISGHVFRDDAASGEYADGSPGIAGAEVVLDNEQHRRTDEHGFYLFQHVTAGPHRLEVIPHTSAASYFTTPSSTEVEINSRVNFGIAFAAGHVFGSILSDAGEPIAGVTVHLKSARQDDIVLTTGDSGQFDRAALPPGTYTVFIDANSVPPGYWLAGLKKQTVTAEAAQPAQVDFQLKASRAIVGRVSAYDPHKTRELGMPGVVVTLSGLQCAVLTDKNGVFRFKDLPAGRYTVATVYKGKEVATTVTLAGGPSLVSNLELKLGTK